MTQAHPRIRSILPDKPRAAPAVDRRVPARTETGDRIVDSSQPKNIEEVMVDLCAQERSGGTEVEDLEMLGDPELEQLQASLSHASLLLAFGSGFAA